MKKNLVEKISRIFKGKNNDFANGRYEKNDQNIGVNKVSRKAIIRSAAFQHQGISYTVSSTPLYIGKDKNVCNLLYKEGTAGVSGKHCELMYIAERNEFVLKDLGSTHGTFLASGRRLQSEIMYTLKSGDAFYIGNKPNMLVVEVV